MNDWKGLPRWEWIVFMIALILILALALTACGDVEQDAPKIDHRQRCVDQGKVALIEDHKLVGCVTVDEYTKLQGAPEQSSG